MKVLIIGKNGQVGHELVEIGIQKKYAVISLSQSDLNITNEKKVHTIIKKHQPDIVINTAAYHHPKDSEENPEKTFLTNTVAVKYLAEACKKNNVKFVHYSTDRVF